MKNFYWVLMMVSLILMIISHWINDMIGVVYFGFLTMFNQQQYKSKD